MYVEQLRLTRSFAFSRVWGSDEEHDLHVHDCLEIGVLLEEELEYRFGDRTYRGRPGDVFLCRPFEPHWSFAQPGKPFEAILVLFTPSAVLKLPDGNRLLLPFYAERGMPPFIPGDTPYAKVITQAARSAAEAQEQGAGAWVTRQYMHLIDILLQVDGFVHERRGHKTVSGAGSAVAESVGYVLAHYLEPLDGDELARQAGIGRSLYYREFRLLTGLSPHDFVNRLRIQAAMDLLRISELPIIEIAERSGFQSLSAFNKQFKAYAECSPREYRNRYAHRL
ncbi:hypothetical protein SD70_03210 [Gordoniibacillus kamchatkensis]|uniref:HTH araC/xylS-type domain-containing protein n=1 Tax=Gordoniibacillus kamchatkensis TaxID=1590651 RepID=A0ABR5AMB7_9BACL|nr:AraC family transcriptional regulator [Paenibacillus sp. VKM B-2647]KIL42178.1 hypothetical protein SD70_03210 [Paenibacillus sp. VKM B-2647]